MFRQLIDTDFSDYGQVTSLTKNVITAMQKISIKHKVYYKYDILIFVEVLKKTHYDLTSISGEMNGKTPSIYKQHAIFAYWLKRLKPFNENSCKYANYTNETIALTFAIGMINQSVHKDKKLTRSISKEYLNNMLYLIRFEQVSKYGMLMFLTAMFEIK